MDYFDELEIRSPEQRERQQFELLREQLMRAKARAPALAALLGDCEPAGVVDRDALAGLPVTRKSELMERQKAVPPFGGWAATPTDGLARIFQSPGPIYEPQGRSRDFWRFARAMYAAGIRAGDLVYNTFSYHFTPAGFMMESGAEALGCPVFPAGVGQTELQVRAVSDLKPAAYVGTPSFLSIILEKADEMGQDATSFRHALVTGEALPGSLRERLQSRGIDVLQCYGTADLGLIAYESPAREGMVVDEGVILEIVRPGTDNPVEAGEVGEVVVTTLNADYPLLRFGTGDLSAIMPGHSPCGRTNLRIRGWLGRADQTTKVRGMFVHPGQVAEVLRRHAELRRARLEVERVRERDVMTLKCESSACPDGLREAVAETVREVCKLRADVLLVGSGELPNDGKVIADMCTYE